MGDYLNNEGKFRSDKYPELPDDKIILSFRDSEAHEALRVFAESTSNKELGEDVKKRLESIAKE